ncbi:hypothetical protein [Streptomyces sp. NPDC005549]|uniref:hypothetical protein n=1 Tax=Streptomyces sp. NPDC005549 TaxID=3154888 RepID=UPI0033B9C8DB
MRPADIAAHAVDAARGHCPAPASDSPWPAGSGSPTLTTPNSPPDIPPAEGSLPVGEGTAERRHPDAVAEGGFSGA